MRFRLFETADADALAPVLAAMQAHYAAPCPPLDEIAAGLRNLPAGNRIVLAQEGALAGFAAFALIYPGPGLRTGLFLKELYVDAAQRGRGVGRGLMRAVAAIAVAEGLGRIDWTADRADAALLAFYRSLGATPQEGKLFFRLSGAALAAAAA